MNITDDEQLHVIPLNDLREHEINGNCWCNPTCDDDEIYMLWIHKSMDGREDFETGKRLPS